MCRMGANPRARTFCKAASNRSACRRVNASSPSAAAKWEKAPSICTSGQLSHARSKASRSSQGAPMRRMPVSILRCASARVCLALASFWAWASVWASNTANETPLAIISSKSSRSGAPSTSTGRLDAVFPQFQRLFRRGHGKARRARAQAGARHRDGAMPIRVGFHHGHHRRVGLLRNLAQIAGNGRGGNGQFGRSHSSRTCSCVSNVTLCARNRRSAASRSVTRKITSA